jgi:hypothetical protein
MEKVVIWTALALLGVLLPTEFGFGYDGFSVVHSVFDPHGTHLVAAGL